MNDPRVWTALLCLAGCNAVTGVNDYSTPSCEDCERRECAEAFTACRTDVRCTNLTMCVERCSSPDCVQRCQLPPIPDGGGPPPEGGIPLPDGDGGVAADLMACAQTRCPVCTPH
jgi:hypothetical protein